MHGSSSAAQKRKASESLTKEIAERRKITRACDSCKVYPPSLGILSVAQMCLLADSVVRKKTRCSGTLPCSRCTKLSRACEYTALYTRGTPPSPLPGPASSSSPGAANHNHRRQNVVQRATPSATPIGARGPVSPTSPFAPSSSLSPRQPTRIRGSSKSLAAVLSPRSSSPEPEATDLEGNYLGPCSGISFLSRSWRRLKQDNISAAPKIPGNAQSKNTPVLLFGDRPFSDKADWSTLQLPPREQGKRLLDLYFDFSIVTYRFLHRGNVMAWLDMVYEKNILPSNSTPNNLAAKVGVIYMIFAMGMLGEEQSNGNDEIHPKNERCVRT